MAISESQKRANKASYARHKAVRALRMKAYYDQNRKKIIAKQRVNYFKQRTKILHELIPSRYGMTLEDYRALFRKQNRACAICKLRKRKRLQIDHDHVTGKVRGLLCRNCNYGLGNFKDNQRALRAAIQYLKRPPCTN